MSGLITEKIQAILSVTAVSLSWAIAQFPIIEQGTDQLISLGLLVFAVVAVWKAFNRKDASETKLLNDRIEAQEKHIATLEKIIEDKRDK